MCILPHFKKYIWIKLLLQIIGISVMIFSIFHTQKRKDNIVFTKERMKISSTRIGYFPTINCLYSMIPRETREHMERVGRYSELLFRALYDENRELINREFGENFLMYSEEVFKYHDIGRFFIPISVLNKVEKLTDEEFQMIKDHAVNAVPAIASVYKKPFPKDVMVHMLNIAVYHHEKWDGTGYPKGMKGTEIPLGARICAIADTYDGITSWKPYKKKQTTTDEAVLIITKESGKQFDPHLVDVFRSCIFNS